MGVSQALVADKNSGWPGNGRDVSCVCAEEERAAPSTDLTSSHTHPQFLDLPMFHIGIIFSLLFCLPVVELAFISLYQFL